MKSGEPTAVTITFGPAAAVTGRVVGGVEWKGIGGVELQVLQQVGESGGYRHLGAVTTAADGTYTAYGDAGVFRVQVQSTPPEYTRPADGQRGTGVAVKVELGGKHRFPDIALPDAVSFKGRVVLSDGKPAAGALVLDSIALFDYNRFRDGVRTDADGRFTLDGLLPDEIFDLRIQLGKRLNVPAPIEAKKGAEPTVIELSEANGTTIAGVITDGGGKPVAGATVALQHNITGIGRFSRSPGHPGLRRFWGRTTIATLRKRDHEVR